MCGVNTGSYTDIPPDSNTEYTWELLIFIHCSLYMIEVRLRSLVEQILCSSVGLFGCQKVKVSSLRWGGGGEPVNQAEGVVPSTSIYMCVTDTAESRRELGRVSVLDTFKGPVLQGITEYCRNYYRISKFVFL